MRSRIGFVLLLLGLCAATGLSQIGNGGAVIRGAASTGPIPSDRAFTSSVIPPYNSPCVTGGPYSAEQVSESAQTLADGTHINRPGPVRKMYRDSQGRTRTERPMGIGTPDRPVPVAIEVRDCVAGVAYVLDPDNQVAHRVTLQPYPGMAPPAPRMVSANLPTRRPGAATTVSTTSVMSNGAQSKMEFLGTQTIEGVETEGRRMSMTYPAGFNGADRPVTSVTETWTSPYFDTSVLSKSSDPRGGDTTQKLINVRLIEPDPALFQPPAGYKVVDEPGPQVRIPFNPR